MGASFIALILKKDGALSIKGFRPISLIGSLYKILVKVPANWLALVLHEVIFDTQSAFVSDQQILDSVPIVHECVDSCYRDRFLV